MPHFSIFSIFATHLTANADEKSFNISIYPASCQCQC